MKGVGTMEVNKEEIKEASMFEHAAVSDAVTVLLRAPSFGSTALRKT